MSQESRDLGAAVGNEGSMQNFWRHFDGPERSSLFFYTGVRGQAAKFHGTSTMSGKKKGDAIAYIDVR